ncbi:hypothetical protein V3481_012560 [Fusarium oxysporum f. sp. vasinfectum]
MPIHHSRDITSAPTYRLEIRQQPSTTFQSCDSSDSKGTPIVPFPVIELITGDPDIMEKPCKYKYFLICSIVKASNTQQSLTSSDRQTILSGGLVSDLFIDQDESGKDVYLFKFPNIHCQASGTFQLKFALGKIDPRTVGETKKFPFLCNETSQPFIVDCF